ncbi:hypothetical protein GOBAR_AA10230 [Gossypium barbadense]|uniref:Protein FAR1-RELATED SEQUENCE n=1 Tax=Gossypium barbadense TaxID=3634 RepID=A0A2P5Y4A9_GOSBA|nr:hypothetical protein GOBAR_AA10230 [Gossypium barbadense]
MDRSGHDILTHGKNSEFQNELHESNRADVDMGEGCKSSETSSPEKSREATESENDSWSGSASLVEKSVVEINGDECQAPPEIPLVNKYEMNVDSEQESQSLDSVSVDVLVPGVHVKDGEDLFMVPAVGMEFESEEHAYKCYSRYAVLEGFTCYRQGYRPSKHTMNTRKPRKETRTGCLAHMTIAWQPYGKFRVTNFENKHNHEFVNPSTAHLLPSQKREGFCQKDKRDLNIKRPRKETRIGCLAQLVISHQSDGSYRVTNFEEKHNHELVAACRIRMLRSQKRLVAAQIAEGNAIEGRKIQLKSAYEVSCNSIEDCVDHAYDPVDRRSSPPFVNDLLSCFFDHEEEEDFIASWNHMMDLHGVWDNEWLNKIFKTREQWAIAYKRHIFCADIKSVQLRGSFILNLKKYLKSDSDVLSFLKQLGKMVNDCHHKELEANYDMSQNMPKLMGDVILLKYARDAYTPRIFELLQQEYETCLNIVVNQCIENGSLLEYKVSIYGQPREYTVSYNLSNNTVCCSCMQFEFIGVLCSHALKVLDYSNIRSLPSQYILKRWTREARV